MDADAGAAPPLAEGEDLTGRYRLVRRTGGSAPAHGPAPLGTTSTWHARDLVLRRRVELLAVAGGAEDVVDAARRAALVEDPRVLRVLDVGSTVVAPGPDERPEDTSPGGPEEGAGDVGAAGWSFVVTESVAGESLAALVRRHGPLPAPLVRTLVGEAAQALERARSLGLHHRRLSPEHLLRARDGGVVVTGVEILAAAADGDPAEPVPPGSRVDDDVVGVPLDHPQDHDQHRDRDQHRDAPDGRARDEGLRTSGRRAAVPGDVDPAVAARADAVALVALVYAGVTGRWPDPLRGAATGRPDQRPDPAAHVDAEGHTPEVAGGLAAAPRDATGPVPPGDLVEDVPADLDVLCSVVLGPHEDGPRTPGELAEQLAPWESPYLDGRPGGGGSIPTAPAVAGTAAAGAAGAASVPAARRPGSTAPDGDVAVDDPGPLDGPGDLHEEPEPDERAAPVPVGALAGTRPATAQVSAAGVGGADDGPARAARPALRPRRTATPATADGTPADGVPLAGAGGAHASTGGGAGSGARPGAGSGVLAAEPARRPSRAQSAVVIVIALAAVVVALVLALGVLQGIGSGGGGVEDETAPVPGPSAGPSSVASTAPPSSPAPSAVAPTGPVPVVSEGAAVDPGGDGEENDDEVPDALDDDPGTAWTSSTYTTEDFGNLKTGLGYALQLVQPALVSEVSLTTEGEGGSVELRTSDGAVFEGSEVVATADLDGGEVDIVLDEPVQAQDLLLWFTSLPEVEDGYAVELSQVQVS